MELGLALHFSATPPSAARERGAVPRPSPPPSFPLSRFLFREASFSLSSRIPFLSPVSLARASAVSLESRHRSSRSTGIDTMGEEEMEGMEEEGESSSSASILSLSEKPDRNLALLDEYELEELEKHSVNPNHRSGRLFAIPLFLVSLLDSIIVFCLSLGFYFFFIYLFFLKKNEVDAFKDF